MIVSLLSIVTFIQILFVRIYTEDTFDCTGHEDDSIHPIYNTENCRYYWQCIYVDTVYMRAVKRTCPTGTEFDVQLNECEIASLVNCVKLQTSDASYTSTSTKQYSMSFVQKRSTRTDGNPSVNTNVTITIMSAQRKVLPFTTSQLTPSLFIEHFMKNLIALKQNSARHTMPSEIPKTTIHTFPSQSTSFPTSAYKRKHSNRRKNLTLNILTSNEHKIRQFTINQTHGILIHCNEIRRRHLRDLVFRSTTTLAHLFPNQRSSSNSFPSDIFSLTILINAVLFLHE